MDTSLSRILFNLWPQCTGLINVLSSLAGSRQKHTLPLTLGTRTKLFHHSDVSSLCRVLLFVVFAVFLALLLGVP